jgi:hypothetical protein
MAIPQSKHYYEPRSMAHFPALEQTCRLRKLSGSGGKYFFPSIGFNQGNSTAYAVYAARVLVLSVRLSSPGRHPKTSGFDVAAGRI